MAEKESVYRRALWNAASILENRLDCPKHNWTEKCVEIEDRYPCIKCWFDYLVEEAKKK